MVYFSTWRAAGESAITSAANLKERLALCSPSAAITWIIVIVIRIITMIAIIIIIICLVFPPGCYRLGFS